MFRPSTPRCPPWKSYTEDATSEPLGRQVLKRQSLFSVANELSVSFNPNPSLLIWFGLGASHLLSARGGLNQDSLLPYSSQRPVSRGGHTRDQPSGRQSCCVRTDSETPLYWPVEHRTHGRWSGACSSYPSHSSLCACRQALHRRVSKQSRRLFHPPSLNSRCGRC